MNKKMAALGGGLVALAVMLALIVPAATAGGVADFDLSTAKTTYRADEPITITYDPTHEALTGNLKIKMVHDDANAHMHTGYTVFSSWDDGNAGAVTVTPDHSKFYDKQHHDGTYIIKAVYGGVILDQVRVTITDAPDPVETALEKIDATLDEINSSLGLNQYRQGFIDGQATCEE